MTATDWAGPGQVQYSAAERPSARIRVAARGLGYGTLTGAVSGGLVITPFFPVIGTFFGAIVGAPIGALVGLVTGVALALLHPARGATSGALVRLVAAAAAAGCALVMVDNVDYLPVRIGFVVASALLAAALGTRVAFGRPMRVAAGWSARGFVPVSGNPVLARRQLHVVAGAACGAVAGMQTGALLGVVAGWRYSTTAPLLVDGALVGTVLGALAGVLAVLIIPLGTTLSDRQDGR